MNKVSRNAIMRSLKLQAAQNGRVNPKEIYKAPVSYLGG